MSKLIKKITSKDNFIIKKVRQLKTKKGRDKYNEFLVEGLHLIEESIKNNIEINFIVYCDTFLMNAYNEELISYLHEKNVHIYNISDQQFKQITETETPQGILGVVKKPCFDLHQVLSEPKNNILILDRIQDPGNMGTILRTADAAGINSVIIIKGSVDIYLPKTIRAAAGSIFRLPILHMDNPSSVMFLLKKYKKKAIATSPKAACFYYDLPLAEDVALIIGNEANGVSQEFLEQVNHVVKIPMLRNTESLNASIAASIVMYEMVRQKIMVE